MFELTALLDLIYTYTVQAIVSPANGYEESIRFSDVDAKSVAFTPFKGENYVMVNVDWHENLTHRGIDVVLTRQDARMVFRKVRAMEASWGL